MKEAKDGRRYKELKQQKADGQKQLQEEVASAIDDTALAQAAQLTAERRSRELREKLKEPVAEKDYAAAAAIQDQLNVDTTPTSTTGAMSPAITRQKAQQQQRTR